VKRRALGALLGAVALAAAGCGGAAKHAATPTPASPFAYDTAASLALRDAGRVNANYPVAIHDVSYVSGGRRVDAFLITPPRAGRRAAVIYVHGSGGDRRQLLFPAVWLAGRGAVTLTITAPSAQATMPTNLSPTARLRWQRDIAEADVVAVRRGLDLLAQRPDVDPERLGYVGWSAGAKTGALLAGSEPRLKALVLMSGGSPPLATFVTQAPAALRADVHAFLSPVDPIQWIRRAKPGSLFLQDATKDKVVPHSALVEMANAAPKGTKIRWYKTGHELDDAAFRDQLAWLTQKLEVGPTVRGARTGP
jgi:dienelactone hydrolase